MKNTIKIIKFLTNWLNSFSLYSLIGGSDYKLIYRHYATLYFVFCVDSSESELGILDLIQVFVETLDKCFENVCELDLIFHVDKVVLLLLMIYNSFCSYKIGIVRMKCTWLIFLLIIISFVFCFCTSLICSYFPLVSCIRLVECKSIWIFKELSEFSYRNWIIWPKKKVQCFRWKCISS